MSGGSMGYLYANIEDQAVGSMLDPELDDLMADVAKLVQKLEWFTSGDSSEDAYRKTVLEFKKKWFETDPCERLKSYVDQELDKVKKTLYDMLCVGAGGFVPAPCGKEIAAQHDTQGGFCDRFVSVEEGYKHVLNSLRDEFLKMLEEEKRHRG